MNMNDVNPVLAESAAQLGSGKLIEEKIVDITQIQNLRDAIGAEAVIEIANLFIVEAENCIAEISDALTGNSCDEIARKAHATKSGAATLGCSNLAGLLEEIELAAKDNQADLLGPMVSTLQSYTEDSLRMLQQKLQLL